MANVVNDTMYNQLKQLYGGDAGKASKAKAKIESSYSEDQYNKLVSGLNAKYGSGTSTTTTPTSTPKATNQQTITYNGQVSGNTSGTANMNSMSQTAAQANSRDFQVGTGDVAEMPERPTQSVQQPSTTDKLAKAWEGLDYETQQKKLNSIAGLKEALAKKGITSKTQPTTATTATTATKPTTTTQQRTTQTPKQDQWDYQDNSQARMNQIADNLNGYRQTMPQLFDDGTAFYNFFIKDKGRSQDQIDFLWDYFNRVQKYGKYDNLSPEQLGTGIANGDIPEDYLNTLKTTDPQKYQEVMAAKQNREDTIKNESFLNDAATMAGIEGWESEPSSIQYGKWNEIWMDKDNNGIDDRREHYASEEEKGYQKQIADLNAANLDIDNTVKHDYEDLVKRYPGATKATLMAMANDRNANLLREKENNLVELTRLQGYVGYMQDEREEMNKAGADSIAQLQKNLGMYYQYSPEGMAELAQAKYAATNITLDQADSGNETQKQMALQSVLDDYYDKYGSIIQRSEQQVINDVIAYAKKNGIGLAQALQENFVKPLQSKPEFAQLNTIPSTNPEIVKVGDNAYAYWDDGKLVSIGGTLGANGVYQFSDAELRTVGSDGKFTDTVGNDINSIGHILNSEDGLRIGTYTNPKGYTYNVYATREDGIQATENLLRRAYYGMTLGDAAQKWIGQGKDISDAKKVIQSKGLGLNDKLSDANVRKFIEAIGTREGTLKGKSLDEWAKGGKTLGTPKGTEGGQKRNPDLETFLDKWKDAEGDRLKEKDFWATYGKELEAKGVSKEDFLKQFKEYYAYDARDAYLEILSNLDHLIELTGKEFDWGERASALSGLGDAGKVFKYIKNNLTVNGLQEARERGLKLGVLSDSDVKMIAEAASVLNWDVSQETWNRALQDFRQSLLSNNPYLKEQYKYQSAYSPNVGFKYNDNDKSFTFGTKREQSGTQGMTQGTTQGTTAKAKSIKDLTKVNR